MSIVTVKAAIKAATSEGSFGCSAGAFVDGKEAQNIINTAVHNKNGDRHTPVTKGEIKQIVDLFDRKLADRGPGMMHTMACPENPNAVAFDKVAVDTFKAFFANHGVEHPVLVADQVKDKLSYADLGDALSCAPDVKGMTPVFVSDDRFRDGPRTDAFVDSAAGAFYVKSTPARFAPGAKPSWYGPLSLAPSAFRVNIETRNKIENAIHMAEMTGVQFNPGDRDSLPLGIVFHEVDMGGQHMMADGFTYTAYLPNGGLHQNAKPQNPNDASYAFIVRSGGFAGLTTVARVDLNDHRAPRGVVAA